MFTYEVVKDKPALLLALTSLNRKKFEPLVVYFRAEWKSHVEPNAPSASERQRIGAYRNYVLASCKLLKV